MNLKVTQITFDLDPGDDSIPQEHIDQVQQELQQDYIGELFAVEYEDDLVDLISDESGWCIKSIQYEEA
jgi:hypothetical protein